LRPIEALTDVAVAAETAERLLSGAQMMPPELCCNCAAPSSLTGVAVLLPSADLGREVALRLVLPHCPMCIPTARRPPPRLGRTLGMVPLALFVSTILVGGVLGAAGWHPGGPSTAVVFLVIVVLAVAFPLWLLRWRPPPPGSKTSR